MTGKSNALERGLREEIKIVFFSLDLHTDYGKKL